MKMKRDSGTVQKPSGRTKIHNVRFYNLAPREIKCMDYNKIDLKLALARNDGSIEIWDMKHAPHLEKAIPRATAQNSVESIVWAGKRLFTAGFKGEVIEWDLETMEPRYEQRVTGNAIWCLAVNRECTELAIGTEEGYINIFDIENDEFQYKLLYDKQEGRVLCCSFDVTGNYLVTGSVEVLRVWDARTGHALNKMTLPKSVSNDDTIIWTVRVLGNFSIVAGDSRGYITVYDGHTGAQLEAHQVLKADVLTVCVNEAEDMLVCSGVEPLIRIYAKTQIKREDTTFYRWVKYLQRAVHDHDVRVVLCTAGERILSGGVDGYLGISSITRMRSTISLHGPFLKYPCAAVASVKELLLLRYPNHLEIWRLGTEIASSLQQSAIGGKDTNSKKSSGKNLSLATSPQKLLEMRSKNDSPIVCAALSPDGQWLCYSTVNEIRLLRFTPSIAGTQQTAQLTRCRIQLKTFEPTTHLAFSSDSQQLFTVSRSTKQVRIFSMKSKDDGDVLRFETSTNTASHLKGSIVAFALSDCGERLALADDHFTIGVWALSPGKSFEHYLNLPRYEAAATTAIALHANVPRIVATYADSRIVEYDLEKACFTCWWDQAYIVPNTETHSVTQIILDARNPDIFILQNDSYLYALEKYASTAAEVEDADKSCTSKKTKSASNIVERSDMSSLRLKFQKLYEHLVYTSWLNSDSLVTISVNRNALIEQLPAAFKQKKYGAS